VIVVTIWKRIGALRFIASARARTKPLMMVSATERVREPAIIELNEAVAMLSNTAAMASTVISSTRLNP
jgi:hypothetical protein